LIYNYIIDFILMDIIDERYKNGKIYEISYDGYYYVGSTIDTLDERIRKHLVDYRKQGKYVSSEEIFKLSLNFNKDVIENYPCNNKQELEKREGFHILEYKKKYGEKCVNKKVSGRTDAEYREQPHIVEHRKKYMKSYNYNRKDEQKEYKIIYNENNREYILKKGEIYRETNREALRISDSKRYYWKKSWGGDIRFNNNLLQIRLDLFV